MIEEIYKKCCDALISYPEGPQKERIKEQKEKLEKRFPKLKEVKNGTRNCDNHKPSGGI
jgi:hypothetical protein